MAVLDDAYKPVPAGQIGRMLIAADNPASSSAITRTRRKPRKVIHDGWYHTGDLAYVDEDGYYWIAGRSDDCFKSRGIFISPIEIENALRGHPAVAEACVVPKPDKEIGNRIRAVVVLRGHEARTDRLAEEIRIALRGRSRPTRCRRS